MRARAGGRAAAVAAPALAALAIETPDAGWPLAPPVEHEVPRVLALFSAEVRAGRMLPRDPAELAARLGDWLVAREGASVIGCVSLVSYGPELSELRSLAVEPARRGRGLGGALIEGAVALAARRGAGRVLTLTRRTALFEAHGFARSPIDRFPEKVWRDCAPCPLRHRCDETALVREVGPAPGPRALLAEPGR